MPTSRVLRPAHTLFAIVIVARGAALAAPPPPGPSPVTFGVDMQLSVASNGIHDFVEPAIAVNPVDPMNFVAAFFGEANGGVNTCFFRSSRDGGATWAPGGTAPVVTPNDFCADPAMAADATGIFYYSYIDLTFGEVQARVARSVDGGLTFPDFSVAVDSGTTPGGPSPDKPWIVVDTQPKSANRGTIYLTYTDAAMNTQNMVVISRDGGRTWSAPAAVSEQVPFTQPIAEIVEGTLPVVAPDGMVFVFYLHANQQTMKTAIRFVKSRDGGRTWSSPADVAAGLPAPGLAFLLNDGSQHFGTYGGLQAWSYPTAAATPDGTLYVAWTDFPQGSCVATTTPPSCINSDVRLSVSRDGGRSWSAPVKVSDDSGTTDQFFPWIAAHANGLVSLVWLDRRLDSSNVNYDLYYTNTGDGRRFLPNVRVSLQSSLGSHGGFIGDYNGLAVSGDSIVPVWNDLRQASGVEIFAARGALVP